MAIAKTARVQHTQPLFENSRLLTLALDKGEPLGFVGGQYVIVDSGETQPSGKPVKRAYSILSADTEQCTITLAVLRINDEPGARHMQNLKDGDVVNFSGPWGTLRPQAAAPAPTLVCATDAGITAALGLVRGEGFRGLRAHTTFVWLKQADDYLMPESMVRDFLPPGMHHVHIATCANATDAERTQAAMQTTCATPSYQNAYVAGDAQVNAQLRRALCDAGTDDGRIWQENFVNAALLAALTDE